MHRTVAQYVDTVRDAQYLAHLLLDYQHRDAGLAPDLLNALQSIVDQRRRESQGWLVQEQQTRRGYQGVTQRQHLLFAAGKGASSLCEARPQCREESQDTLNTLRGSRLVPEGLRPKLKIFADGEALKNPVALGCVSHSCAQQPLRCRCAEISTFEEDLTRPDRQQSKNSFEKSGLD